MTAKRRRLNAAELGRKWAGASALLAALAVSSGVVAQERPEMDTQTFRPAVGPYSIFTLETSPVLGHLDPTGAVVLNYASRPLIMEQAGADDIAVIDQQLAMHVVAGVGLFDLMQLNMGLPIYFINDSNLDGSDVQGGIIGDLRLTPKFEILSRETMPIGLGAQVDVTLPSGREQSLVGKGSVTVAPTVILDYQVANVVLATNLGVRVMEDKGFGNLNSGDRFEYGFGAEAEFLQGLLRVGGELYGSTQLGDFFANSEETPLEGILGAKVVTDTGFSVFAGGGAGLVGGVGAPEFRAFLGLRYAMVEPDEVELEAASIPEEEEAVEVVEPAPQPEPEPEPPADRDQDGVPDDQDQCPDEPGPADNEGCPLPEPEPEPIADRDQDGVPDDQDKCPDEPGIAAEAGCPPKEVKAVREREEIKIQEKVYFELGKARLKPESYNILQQVALVLRNNPDITRVEIAGHTDRLGPATDNMVLSEQRAQEVKAYLVKDGRVDADRLVAKGYGESKPLVAPEGPKAQAENRRVEFKILEQGDAFKKK